jgi:hypothetical protein
LQIPGFYLGIFLTTSTSLETIASILLSLKIESFFVDAAALRPDTADQNSVNVKRRFGDYFCFK